MAPAMATARLRKELIKLQTEPPPGVIAEPDESNILKWHYAIRGATDTAFEEGVYLGKIVFPSEYPMKGPGIMMLTPSGRFQVNTRLCMSMSDFHPESWNPLWSVASIIQGIQSFMASDELTTGGLKSPESEHKKCAALSMQYNQKMFPTLFGGDIEAAFEAADKARQVAEEKAAASATATTNGGTTRRGRGRRQKSNTGAATQCAEAEAESEQNGDKEEDAATKELSPAEIEKRRKRNAKKRAKQKAKKAELHQASSQRDDPKVDTEPTNFA